MVKCLLVLSLVMVLSSVAFAGVEPVLDVAYGPAERQRLDLYPAPGGEGLSPVLVYFHGGGFARGDKSGVSAKLVSRLHELGISVVAVNYRFVKTDPLPAAMLDGARAIQHLRLHAETYELDGQRIAVMGSSAGAGIALWVALHDDVADSLSDDPVLRESSRVSGAWVKDAQVSYDPEFWRGLGLGRLVDTRSWRYLVEQEGEELTDEVMRVRVAEASPITHVTADDPAVRLDYAAELSITDRTSPGAMLHHPSHGVALHQVCEAAGVSSELYYKGGPVAEEAATSFLARVLEVSKVRD